MSARRPLRLRRRVRWLALWPIKSVAAICGDCDAMGTRNYGNEGLIVTGKSGTLRGEQTEPNGSALAVLKWAIPRVVMALRNQIGGACVHEARRFLVSEDLTITISKTHDPRETHDEACETDRAPAGHGPQVVSEGVAPASGPSASARRRSAPFGLSQRPPQQGDRHAGRRQPGSNGCSRRGAACASARSGSNG
jgi:hypothetical protein